jgi:hypothetical protein
VHPRWCTLFAKCPFRSIGVAKMMPKPSQVHLANASLQNVCFAAAGAPLCVNTCNYVVVFGHFDPVPKRRCRVEGVHILTLHTIGDLNVIIVQSTFLQHVRFVWEVCTSPKSCSRLDAVLILDLHKCSSFGWAHIVGCRNFVESHGPKKRSSRVCEILMLAKTLKTRTVAA